MRFEAVQVVDLCGWNDTNESLGYLDWVNRELSIAVQHTGQPWKTWPELLDFPVLHTAWQQQELEPGDRIASMDRVRWTI